MPDFYVLLIVSEESEYDNFQLRDRLKRTVSLEVQPPINTVFAWTKYDSYTRMSQRPQWLECID